MSQQTAKDEILKQLKDERSTLHDMAWELDEVEVKLAELAARQEADPGALAELELLRERQHALEEAVLQQMLYVDRLQQRLDQLRFQPVRAA